MKIMGIPSQALCVCESVQWHIKMLQVGTPRLPKRRSNLGLASPWEIMDTPLRVQSTYTRSGVLSDFLIFGNSTWWSATQGPIFFWISYDFSFRLPLLQMMLLKL